VKLGYFDERDQPTTDAVREAARAVLDGRPFLDNPQTLFEIGSSFEWAVEDALARRWEAEFPSRFARIGTLELDGMIGNPDLIDTVDSAVVEIKLTWMSSRHEADGQKFWKYWVQGMAYAKMLELQRVVIHVCHINGDWKFRDGGPQPVYNIWEEVFDQGRIDRNWKMLTSHRDVLMAA
jgi:hypothetical protein